jgi:hypothetical protein
MNDIPIIQMSRKKAIHVFLVVEHAGDGIVM